MDIRPIRRRPWVGSGACAIALLIVATTVRPEPVATATDDWFDITAIEHGFNGTHFVDVSHSGDDVLIHDVSTARHFDALTRLTTQLPPAESTAFQTFSYRSLTDSGRYAFGHKLRVYDIDASASVDLGVGTDLDGEPRIALLSDDLSTAVAGGRLLDVATETEIDTSGAGLPTADVTAIVDLSGDGQWVTFRQSALRPPGPGGQSLRVTERYVRWNRQTNESATAVRPTQLSDQQEFVIDRELTSIAYYSDDSGLTWTDADGSGAEIELDSDLITTRIVATPGDRIVFTGHRPGEGGDDVYVWHPGHDPRVVNRGLDGKRASAALYEPFSVSTDGSTVVFHSTADNLVENGASSERGLFAASFADQNPDPIPPVPYPIWPDGPTDFVTELLDHGSDDPVVAVSLSASGRGLTVLTTTEAIHIALESGGRRVLPTLDFDANPWGPDVISTMSSSGNHVFGYLPSREEVAVIDLDQPVLEIMYLPLTITNANGSSRAIQSIVDITADGSMAVVNSTFGDLGFRGYLIDIATNTTLNPDGENGTILEASTDGSVMWLLDRTEPGVNEKLVRWDRVAGERTEVPSPPDRRVYSTWSLSPDASELTFVRGANGSPAAGGELVVRDLASDTDSVIDIPGPDTVQSILRSPGEDGRFFFVASDLGAGYQFADLYASPGPTHRSQRINTVDDKRVAFSSAQTTFDQSFVVFLTNPRQNPVSFGNVWDLNIARLIDDQSPATTTTTTTTIPTEPPATTPRSFDQPAQALESAVRIS